MARSGIGEIGLGREGNTRGGEAVYITGSNFRAESFVGASVSTAPNVTYGPTGSEYEAKNCEILSSVGARNTTFRCTTEPGVGGYHSWVIRFGHISSASAGESCSTYSICSRYDPDITSVAEFSKRI